MRYFSLFSGIGGFELGLQEGFDCVGYSEINKYALQIYRYHFPEQKNYGDATRIVPRDLPEFDLLVAGFPCQAFSIAGKRKGFQDTRGTLFFEIARICRDKRPQYILLENVAGILGHEDGKTFQRILGILSDVGYLLQWEVLNSRNFGVPQNRRRVFIVGHLGTTGRPEIFPVGENNGQISQPGDGKCVCSGTVETRNQSGQANWDRSTTLICDSGPGRKSQYRDETVPPLRANTGAGHNNLVVSVISRPHGFNKGNIRECPNVRISAIQNELLLAGDIRRLTPLECERLQAFPDEWTKRGIDTQGNAVEISDTQRYKCLGNAVTVNVISEIGKRFLN